MPVSSRSLRYTPIFPHPLVSMPSALLTTSHCPQMLQNESSRELSKTAKVKALQPKLSNLALQEIRLQV